jgi:hypothetical protein
MMFNTPAVTQGYKYLLINLKKHKFRLFFPYTCNQNFCNMCGTQTMSAMVGGLCPYIWEHFLMLIHQQFSVVFAYYYAHYQYMYYDVLFNFTFPSDNSCSATWHWKYVTPVRQLSTSPTLATICNVSRHTNHTRLTFHLQGLLA